MLGGSNDSLNWCQWVAGFATIAREEQNLEIKNSMLEYLTEIMEDANDFGWQSAKAPHAVLLCRIEDGKVGWSETQKIDRIRRVHVQRGVTQNNGVQNSKSTKSDSKPTMACRFCQWGLCHNQRDHETGGTLYKHVCATCFSMGKENRHMSKDCKVSSRNSKKRVKHCQKAVHSGSDIVSSCHVPKNIYCTSRVVCNSNLYNGTSSNWKADWSRFIGKSYSQVVGSNLVKARSWVRIWSRHNRPAVILQIL